MDNLQADERVMRLERSLLRHGVPAIRYDAVGELDQASLIAAMAGLGYDFRGVEPHGYTWTAEFRFTPSEGRRAVTSSATAYSEHAAVEEAALASLETVVPDEDGPQGGPPPMAWTTWRRSRPWRTIRTAPPSIS